MGQKPISHPNVTTILDNTQKFFEALEDFTNKSVFVGIPSTKIDRQAEPGQPTLPNNAVIGYIMENGDPARNIPARAWLIPSIKDNQGEIVLRLKAISQAAMDGNINKVKMLRMQLGLYAQREAQQKITDGPFQPLAEATLVARARRKFGRGAAGARRGATIELARRAAGLAASTDFARPLIDTGQLRRAVNFVIGPNRSRKKLIVAMAGDWPTFTGTLK